MEGASLFTPGEDSSLYHCCCGKLCGIPSSDVEQEHGNHTEKLKAAC